MMTATSGTKYRKKAYLSVLRMHTDGSWILGGGLDWTNHNPRRSRMPRINDGFSMRDDATVIEIL